MGEPTPRAPGELGKELSGMLDSERARELGKKSGPARRKLTLDDVEAGPKSFRSSRRFPFHHC